MSKYPLLAFASVLFFAFGCSPKPATRSPTDATDLPLPSGDAPAEPGADPRPSDPSPAEAAVLFSGLYREEGGRQLFVPCAEPTAVYELATPDPALAARYAEAIMQGYPGQAVVLDVRGRLLADPVPRAGRTGLVTLASLERIRAKNPRNTCLPYDFWGLGNEPFWSLQISAAEGLAEFSLLGANTVRFAYAPPSVEEEGRITRYFFPGEQRLKATFTEEPCTDSMAGNPYAYGVVVEFAGKTYRGCAQRPPAD